MLPIDVKKGDGERRTMAQYRQSGHYNSSNGAPDLISAGIRGSLSSHLNHIQQKPGRFRRSGRSDKGRLGFPIGAVIVVLCLVLFVTLLAYYYLSTDNRRDENHVEDDEMKNDLDFLANVTRTDTFKVFGFGRGGSAVHGRDSRYWDRDDRRRDDDYNEDDVDHLSKVDRNESSKRGRNLVKVKNGMENFQDGQRGAGLYNEDGLKELKKYETEYEASVHNSGESRKENGIEDHIIDNENSGEQSSEAWDSDNEYDDGIGSHDFRVDKYHDSEPDKVKHSDMRTLHHDDDDDDDDSSVSSNFPSIKSKYQIKGAGSFSSQNSGIVDSDSKHSHAIGGQSTGKLKSESRRRPSRRKFSGSSCEMKLLNSTTQIVEPIENRKFVRFSLQYIEMENPNAQEEWKPRFAGHQSLQEREESFLVHDQKIHCGFVKGPEGTPSTGFDLAEDDVNFISRCHIAVISCIFGNSDRLRSPVSKMVTRLSRKNVCFVMFVDEATFQTLSSEGQMPHREGFIGLWRIVVVKNLPYEDMRRVGKIPKLLPHRLFPSARYSIWLDSKLRLQRDPLIILEYFLWRKGHEYAISNHYDRHCIWEEVAQNKRLNKYNHTIIDQQFSFYQADGLKRFNASDPQKLLPSNVPEGSLILRAHTPMSNLFSCLWFNEVDRFTSRDQLSFGYTYQKLRSVNSGKSFRLNMFKDCERRAVAKLFHHRSQEKRANLQQATE